MFKIKTAPKNSASHNSNGVPVGTPRGATHMGSSAADRHFKNPSKGGPVSKMGRSVPGHKTGPGGYGASRDRFGPGK